MNNWKYQVYKERGKRKKIMNIRNKHHRWGKPIARPPGAIQICKDCGVSRITTIPGYQKSKVGPCLVNYDLEQIYLY